MEKLSVKKLKTWWIQFLVEARLEAHNDVNPFQSNGKSHIKFQLWIATKPKIIWNCEMSEIYVQYFQNQKHIFVTSREALLKIAQTLTKLHILTKFTMTIGIQNLMWLFPLHWKGLIRYAKNCIHHVFNFFTIKFFMSKDVYTWRTQSNCWNMQILVIWNPRSSAWTSTLIWNTEIHI